MNYMLATARRADARRAGARAAREADWHRWKPKRLVKVEHYPLLSARAGKGYAIYFTMGHMDGRQG